MIKWLAFFLLLASPVYAGQGMYPIPMAYAAAIVCDDGTEEDVFMYEGFEGTGYELTGEWTEMAPGCTGCVLDEDYTTDPICGDQSLRVAAGNSASAVYNFISAVDGVYGFIQLEILTMPTSVQGEFVTMHNYDVTDPDPPDSVYVLHVSTGGRLIISHSTGVSDSSETSSTTTMAADGTIYNIWFYFAKGTGSNGTGWAKMTTDDNLDIPETNEIAITDGLGTADVTVASITTMTGSGSNYKIDRFMLSTSPIGDICACE